MSGQPSGRTSWTATTHDWSQDLDEEHLNAIRAAPEQYAPGGRWHLVLEVLAYAADEAACAGGGRAFVTLRSDGAFVVVDQGRGTDTRIDNDGHVVKKPVMGTKDLRFFDGAPAMYLPDGHPRRGISVVAALSDWLEHTNRRSHGSWTQLYERGIPTTDPAPIVSDGTTGTSVTFLPSGSVGDGLPSLEVMRHHAERAGAYVDVTLTVATDLR